MQTVDVLGHEIVVRHVAGAGPIAATGFNVYTLGRGYVFIDSSRPDANPYTPEKVAEARASLLEVVRGLKL